MNCKDHGLNLNLYSKWADLHLIPGESSLRGYVFSSLVKGERKPRSRILYGSLKLLK